MFILNQNPLSLSISGFTVYAFYNEKSKSAYINLYQRRFVLWNRYEFV